MNLTYISGFGGALPKIVFITSVPMYETITDFMAMSKTKPGYILPYVLKEQGIPFSDIYVTSVVKVMPETPNKVPNPEEWKSWQEVLWSELDDLDGPKIIVCLGSIATTAVTGMIVGGPEDGPPKVVNYGINAKVVCTVDLRIVEWMMQFDMSRLDRFKTIVQKAYNMYDELD
jgi:uracil-DNA glycosylase